ncbi:hypothetical protein KHQ81_13875 [Mycoplasmatota bacterium]|nr:hypothetical protein KHQ81_13875 [Mycoplasmatota bacterium]
MDDSLKKFHLEMATSNFNKTWDYIDQESRTDQDNINMVHHAHASRYHWGIIGQPINLQRGEWQISRVYCLINMGESALFHANECLRLTEEENIKGFDLAFAYEAIARAYKVLKNTDKMNHYKQLGLSVCEFIENKEDKEYTISELNTI